MARLFQSSSGIANQTSVSGSFWFRFPSFPSTPPGATGALYDMIAWGNPGAHPLTGAYSSVSIQGDGSRMVFHIISPYVDNSVYEFGIFPRFFKADTLASSASSTFSNYIAGTEVSGANDCFGLVAEAKFGSGYPIASPIPAGVWNHVFFSFDTSQDDTYIEPGVSRTLTLNKKINIWVNGVDAFHGASPENRFLVMTPDDGLAPGDTATAPSFSTETSSAEISIPTLSEFITSPNIGPTMDYPAMDRAETQLWFGTYIDSSQISKFVSGGKPVPTSTAAAAFGTQTLLFKGNKSVFGTNLGTGGVFTKSGTINDFSPGP